MMDFMFMIYIIYIYTHIHTGMYIHVFLSEMFGITFLLFFFGRTLGEWRIYIYFFSLQFIF